MDTQEPRPARPQKRLSLQILDLPSSAPRSPTRSPRADTAARDLDPLLANLSPESVLKVLQETDAIGDGNKILAASISRLSESERAFAIRAALVGQKATKWVAQMQEWAKAWEVGKFEPPTPEQAAEWRRLGVHDFGSSEAGSPVSPVSPVSPTSLLSGTNGVGGFCGSFPESTVKLLQERVLDIQEDYDELKVEEVKDEIRRVHRQLSEKGTSPNKMDDFTTVITGTMIQALPSLSRLSDLLDLWINRFFVLRQVPKFLSMMDVASVALAAAMDEVEIDQTSRQNRLPPSLTSQEVRQVYSYLERCVAQLCKKVDVMLDAISGHDDALPDHWIDKVDEIEREFNEWVDLAEMHLKSRLRSTTSAKESSSPVQLPPTEVDEGFTDKDDTSDILNKAHSEDKEEHVQEPVDYFGVNSIEKLDDHDIRDSLEQDILSDVAHLDSVSDQIILPVEESDPEKDQLVSEQPNILLPFSLNDQDKIDSKEENLDTLSLVTSDSYEIGPQEFDAVDTSPTRGDLDLPPTLTSDIGGLNLNSGAEDDQGLDRSPSGKSLEDATPTGIVSRSPDRETETLSLHDKTAVHDNAADVQQSGTDLEGYDEKQDSAAEADAPQLASEDIAALEDITEVSIVSADLEPVLNTPELPRSFVAPGSPQMSPSPSPSLRVPKKRAGLPKIQTQDPDRGISRKRSDFFSPLSPLDLEDKDREPMPKPPREDPPSLSSLSSLEDEFLNSSPKRDKAVEDQLRAKISSMLSRIPAPIKLVSKPKSRQVGTKSRTSSLQPKSAMSTRPSTPLATLEPAESKPYKARNEGDGKIKVYHFYQPGKDGPIKLHVRLVGENGERVMVRVGGGWADLEAWLNEYAQHHSRRAVSEGKFQVTDLSTPKGSPANSVRADSVLSGRTTPGSDVSTSASKLRRTSAARMSPFTPDVGSFPQSLTATPGSVDSARAALRSSSRQSSRSYNDEEPTPLGLAGPKNKKVQLSPRKQAWVDGMLNQARQASAEKKRFILQDMGKVGSTRRIYSSSADFDSPKENVDEEE